MKKLIAVILTLVMVVSLVACGNAANNDNTSVDYSAKSDGVMTYAEYAAAELDTEVVIEGYVQAAQSYWNGAKLYVADPDGAYFVYCDGKGDDVNVSEEDYAKLVASTDYSNGWKGLANGTKVQVTGYKSEWSGEVEIANATVIVMDGEKYIAPAFDATAVIADNEALAAHINQLVCFNGLTVEPSVDDNGVETAFWYGWGNTAQKGDGADLYFNASINGVTYNFCVESYLCYEGSDVYTAVEALNVGDIVNVEGFLYWYNGMNPHVTSVVVA